MGILNKINRILLIIIIISTVTQLLIWGFEVTLRDQIGESLEYPFKIIELFNLVITGLFIMGTSIEALFNN